MKKKVLAFFEAFIALTLIVGSVYATVSGTIKISASTTNLKRGDTVTVTLAVEDVDSTKPITSIAGYINYDTDVFETITYDSIQKSSDGKVTIGDEVLDVEDLTDKNISDMSDKTFFVGFNGNPTSGNQSRILIDLDKGISSSMDILKIDFKVKSNAKTGSISNAIKYDLFVITAGGENSSEISRYLDVNVEGENQNNNNSNTNNNNTNSNTNTNTNTNNTNTNTNTNSNTNNNTNTNTNTNTNSNTKTNTNNTNTNNTTNTNKNGNSNANGGQSGSNTNKSGGGSSSQNSKSDGTSASGVLPKAGAVHIIVPGLIVLSIAVVSYFEYRKIKKNGI